MQHETGMTELTDEVKGLRGDLREILTKLFGDANIENPHGRIPRIEYHVADHERRIDVLETLKTRAGGAWWFVGRVVAWAVIAADLMYHVVTIVRR